MRSQKRLLALLVGLIVLLLVSSVLYMVGMSRLEGQTRTFWRALEFAAETLSTTGYGSDGNWNNPWMVIFVVILQFAGVFLIFLIFPVYLIPFLEERFEARLPKEAPSLSDHVIVYRYGPAVVTLLDDLGHAGVSTVVIESDEQMARRVIERGHNVVFGTLEERALEKAGIDSARTLIANGSDDEDAAVTLAARQLGFEGEVLALVEEPFHRKPIMLAGATAAFTPRHVLGAALAARASQRISPTVADIQQLGAQLLVSEVRITERSSLAGKTLSEAELGRKTGVTVIGQWVGGRLIAPPTAAMRLEAGGVMIVVGNATSLERFEEVCGGAALYRRQGHFVVAGYGEVGSKVVELLKGVGEEVRVIDRDAREGVDVVGNVLDPRVLEEADLASAQALIVALDTDSATLFATVIVKDLEPRMPVIARVNRAVNVERIHRAGADFALSISQVSGQILARRLLGEEAIAFDPLLKLQRVESPDLAGKHPAELGIRERTGCSVVAIERDGELIQEFGDDFRFAGDDRIYVCGSSRATRSFSEVFPPGGARS